MPPGRRTLLILALGLAVLGAGCGRRGDDGAADEPEDPAAGFDDQSFLSACQEGCGSDDPMCARFCACSLEQIHTDPDLARAVMEVGTDDTDSDGVEAIQTRFLTDCGEEFYAHHFTAGCTEGCTDDGLDAQSCSRHCDCLYAALRARHPGPEGLAYLARVYGSEDLPAEARSEIELVRPACGF